MRTVRKINDKTAKSLWETIKELLATSQTDIIVGAGENGIPKYRDAQPVFATVSIV